MVKDGLELFPEVDKDTVNNLSWELIKYEKTDKEEVYEVIAIADFQEIVAETYIDASKEVRTKIMYNV